MLKIWVKILVKIKVKKCVVNTASDRSNMPQTRLKLLQKEQFKKTAEEPGDLIDQKIANKDTKVSKNSQ